MKLAYITQCDATLTHGELTIEMTLEHTMERRLDDDYFNEYTYWHYTPIIAHMYAFDDDGNTVALGDSTTQLIHDFVGSDEFISAFNDKFDADVQYGKSVRYAYADY